MAFAARIGISGGNEHSCINGVTLIVFLKVIFWVKKPVLDLPQYLREAEAK